MWDLVAVVIGNPLRSVVVGLWLLRDVLQYLGGDVMFCGREFSLRVLRVLESHMRDGF